MKKVLTFAFVVLSITVLLTFSAFAAESTSTSVTMNGQATINLAVMDDFSETAADKVLNNGGLGTIEYIDGTLGKAIKISTDGNSGVANPQYNCQYDPTPGTDPDNNDYVWQGYINKVSADTKGFAFRVTAEGQTGFAFEPQFIISGGAVPFYLTATGDDMIVITADGVATVATTQESPWGRTVVKLPENFDGWVIIPSGRLQGHATYNSPAFSTISGIWHTSFFVEQYVESSIGTITVHDMYTIAEDIPEVPEVNEGPEPSGDVSVILYAAAALAAGGAFIALKKRRV